jgi:hypothetical protein
MAAGRRGGARRSFSDPRKIGFSGSMSVQGANLMLGLNDMSLSATSGNAVDRWPAASRRLAAGSGYIGSRLVWKQPLRF